MSQHELQQKLETYAKWFHQHPEPAYHEYETTKRLRQILDEHGIEIVNSSLETGLVAIIRGEGTDSGESHVVAIRGDIDALPIQEKTGLSYASNNKSYMHGCGHDYNMTTAIGAAIILGRRRKEFAGTVKVILQPAEEVAANKDTPTGAVAVLNTGVLDDVEVFYGIHDTNDAEPGTILVAPGPDSGSVDKFHITVHGRGTHAARPQGGINPILPVTAIIMGIQSISGQDVNPTHPRVVTVTHVEAGNTWNVVPSVAYFEGTARTSFLEDRTIIHDRLLAIVDGIASSYGAKADCEWEYGSPAVVNDRRWSALVESVATDLGFEVTAPSPSIGGEDFSYYLQRAPGTFIHIGVGNSDRPMHGPTFFPKLDVLVKGADLLATVALCTLNEL